MDKNAIKKYAIFAREELIKRVSIKAEEYGVSADVSADPNATAIGERVLSSSEIDQRRALINTITDRGYNQVIEEIAYTWFNRFIALRFMEVNNYLPSKVRVFTNENNEFKPQILDEALHMKLEGLDKAKVIRLKDENKTDELYKYLLITQCNALHDCLPQMFQRISDYTELLFPDNLRVKGSVIDEMIKTISQDDFDGEVEIEILGWLYQFYNTEPKSIVDKQKTKITKDQLPAATQLFTPQWIVKYMVENSLGKVWIESLKQQEEKNASKDEIEQHYLDKWKYYIPEAEQTEEVEKALNQIKYNTDNLEELKIIDPCMGSGHILVYTFDVLLEIYIAKGYSDRDAVASIVENNLFGLDIDYRAYQFAYFAIMMKARQYDRRFLTRGIEPQVYSPKGYKDGEEYGSLLSVDELESKPSDNEDLILFADSYETKLNIWNFRRLLSQKYDVVITNPPYKGSSDLNPKLNDFIKKNYPDSKADMFAVFIERCLELTKNNGHVAMVTMHSWMFLSSYEKLRLKIQNINIVNMAHLGAKGFEEISGEVVQTTTWIMRKSNIKGYNSVYERLVDFKSQQLKEDAFLTHKNVIRSTQENFSNIPGTPIAYWSNEKNTKVFSDGYSLGEIAQVRQGLASGNNDMFYRSWTEVDVTQICFDANSHEEVSHQKKLYAPINKGGGYKKWYGLNNDVIKFDQKYYNLLLSMGNHLPSRDKYFKAGITWGKISSGKFSCRLVDTGFIFSDAGMKVTLESDKRYYLSALLQSCVTPLYLNMFSETLNYESGNLSKIPVLNQIFSNNKIKSLVHSCVEISRDNWDSYEKSWDFTMHPLIISNRTMERANGEGEKNENEENVKYPRYIQLYSVGSDKTDATMENAFNIWNDYCVKQFEQLKSNEEELNRIFIDIYGLREELTPKVEDKDITILLADKTRDIKSFISYAVGCMFGRYSLDEGGLVFAGGEFDLAKYKTFTADKDNIIPICDDEYFEDDIVGRFVEFVKCTYGSATLEDNLYFIADILGGKGTPREKIRNYFIKDFFKDHVNTYSVKNNKTPIYWQFDSGKKNGFKALIYMHRYESDTIARMRTDYIHEQQARYRTAIEDVEHRLLSAEKGDKVKLDKQLAALKDQDAEIRAYEEKIHHLADQMIEIDLDDGVKVNHAKFESVVTKIK